MIGKRETFNCPTVTRTVCMYTYLCIYLFFLNIYICKVSFDILRNSYESHEVVTHKYIPIKREWLIKQRPCSFGVDLSPFLVVSMHFLNQLVHLSVEDQWSLASSLLNQRMPCPYISLGWVTTWSSVMHTFYSYNTSGNT